MKLTSKDFKHNGMMGLELSGWGEGISPQLSWTDLPENTQSVCLMCHDPDAPIASGFWHLQVLDIPIEDKDVARGKINDMRGFHKLNDSDLLGYLPPQPPKGTGLHRYNFTIYAMPFVSLEEVMRENGIELTTTSSKAVTAFFVETNKIASVTLTGKDQYSK